MIIHIVLAICCLISVELIVKSNFKIILSSLIVISKKVLIVLTSEKISDCWKEKIIPYYAISMFKYSIKLFFIICIIVSIFFLPSFLISDFIFFSISLLGIIESIIICIAYMKIRNVVF
jgi:hypothetical protein